MTAATFADCKCGHTKTLHPERNDEACRVPTCDCEEYIPSTLPDARKPVPLTPPVVVRTPPPGRLEADGPSPEQLIAAGKRSESKRIVALAEKIAEQLGDLATRLRQERQAAEERRKRAEEEEKARAEVDRLSRELADARARLKGGSTAAAGSRFKSDGTVQPTAALPCPHEGCDRVLDTPQGLGAHRFRAHGYRKAS